MILVVKQTPIVGCAITVALYVCPTAANDVEGYVNSDYTKRFPGKNLCCKITMPFYSYPVFFFHFYININKYKREKQHQQQEQQQQQ